MKYIITCCIFFSKSFFLFAQNATGLLQGRVLDSLGQSPLESANIIVFNFTDSNAKIRTLTNKNGSFHIHGISLYDSFELRISYTGYSNYIGRFSLMGKEILDLGNIQMKTITKEMDTVLVTPQISPVIIKKDTVEYNAGSFKTGPNAMIEDLLKKLPGLDVDMKGNITFNGKRVSKILVDGREFFVGDYLMTTRNLPADIVSKVQVTDTRTLEQSFTNQPSNDLDKTINIKLKRMKNELFGYGHVGTGTDHRYEMSGMANYFSGAGKLSVIASGNNINNVGFSSGIDIGVVSPGNGILDSRMGGINYNDEWGKKMKISGSYSYQKINTTNESMIDQKQMIVPDSSFFSNTQNNQQQHNTGNQAQFNIEYSPDSFNILNIVPQISTNSFTNSNMNNIVTTTSLGEKINESKGNVSSEGFFNNYSLQLVWGRRLNRKGRSFAVSFNGSQNQQKDNSLNKSENIFYKNDLVDSAGKLNQRILTNSINKAYGVGISFNEPFSKSARLILNENINIGNSNTEKRTYKLDSMGHITEMRTDYSGSFSSYTIINSTNLSMEYSRIKWNLSTGISGFYNELNNYAGSDKTNLKQNEFNFSPFINIIYHLQKGKDARVSYSASTQQPSPDQLQPVPDNSNPLYIKLGNPDLKPSFIQNYSIGYAAFSAAQNIDMSVQYFSYSNKIINGVFYDDYGRQLSKFINVNGSFGLNGNISFARNKKTENSNIRISTGASMNYNRDISVVNNQQVKSENTNISTQVGAGYNYKELLSLNCGYNLSYNILQYNTSPKQLVNYLTQAFNADFIFNVKTFKLMSNINYIYNTNTAPGFSPSSILWNIGMGKSFFANERVQIKLIIYDLLKQNTNLHRSVTNNYIEDAQSNILQRYALVSLTYHLRNNKN